MLTYTTVNSRNIVVALSRDKPETEIVQGSELDNGSTVLESSLATRAIWKATLTTSTDEVRSCVRFRDEQKAEATRTPASIPLIRVFAESGNHPSSCSIWLEKSASSFRHNMTFG